MYLHLKQPIQIENMYQSNIYTYISLYVNVYNFEHVHTVQYVCKSR